MCQNNQRDYAGVTDVSIQCRLKENPPATTVAHAVMISDRKLRFKSDGEKMSVLF